MAQNNVGDRSMLLIQFYLILFFFSLWSQKHQVPSLLLLKEKDELSLKDIGEALIENTLKWQL